MRLLVTGGAGFIGGNFVRYWLENYPGDKVVNFDKLTYASDHSVIADFSETSGYSFVRGDVANPEAVRGVMEAHQPDTVVHFAAESHVDRALLDPSEFVITNVVGTQVLLDAALRHGVQHFHHVSTDEVFGALAENEQAKFSEKTPYAPRNPYSASKASSDHLVRAYHLSYGLKTTITNCSNNYGPYMFPEKLIPLAITNLLAGEPIPIYGHGRQSRDWLHVSDHCRAIDLVLHKGVAGATYCVGGTHAEITNIDVASRICDLMGHEPAEWIRFVSDRAGHDFKYVVDWSKIHRELGWKPLYTFETGLAATIAWYQENKQWWHRARNGSAPRTDSSHEAGAIHGQGNG
jgi:dTDP-glucose 4,6-dehydratase